MANSVVGPCPHSNARLSYLQGATGSTMTPKCLRCHEVIIVSRTAFFMADHSSPAENASRPK